MDIKGKLHEFKDVYVTPKIFGEWDYKNMGYKGGKKISHLSKNGTGIQKYAIESLLEKDSDLDTIIVSLGVDNALGINVDAKNTLKF